MAAKRPPKFDAERRAKFLDGLRQAYSVSRAAKNAGIGYQTAHNLRNADPDFAREWKFAYDEGTDKLEDIGLIWVEHGRIQEEYHENGRLASRRVYSDKMLICLLQARRPELYGRATALRGEKDAPIEIAIHGGLPDPSFLREKVERRITGPALITQLTARANGRSGAKDGD